MRVKDKPWIAVFVMDQHKIKFSSPQVLCQSNGSSRTITSLPFYSLGFCLIRQTENWSWILNFGFGFRLVAHQNIKPSLIKFCFVFVLANGEFIRSQIFNISVPNLSFRSFNVNTYELKLKCHRTVILLKSSVETVYASPTILKRRGKKTCFGVR